MPLSQRLLLEIPSFLLGLFIIGGAGVLSVVGLFVVRRLVPHHRLKVHNDVAGPIFGTLGVVYAVLLAFVVIIVWENFDRANLDVQKEANCVADLYNDAEAFSPEFRQEVRLLCKEYAKAVVNEEWKTLARGELSPHAEEIVKKIQSCYAHYAPRTPTEQIFFAESVHKLNEFDELRLMRLMDAKTGIHPLLWFVLIIGGIVTITFTFFFGSENLTAQIITAVLLAVIISLILFTILLLDFPFTGDIAVSAAAFRQMIL